MKLPATLVTVVLAVAGCGDTKKPVPSDGKLAADAVAGCETFCIQEATDGGVMCMTGCADAGAGGIPVCPAGCEPIG